MAGAAIRRKAASVSEANPRAFALLAVMAKLSLLLPFALLLSTRIYTTCEGAEGTARAQMSNLADAIRLYRLDHRTVPPELEDLTMSDAKGSAYMDRIPLDPWRGAYAYRVLDPARLQFEILCRGEDREFGTDDDLSFPPRDQGCGR